MISNSHCRDGDTNDHKNEVQSRPNQTVAQIKIIIQREPSS